MPKPVIVTKSRFSVSQSRYAFLKDHYKSGQVLDVGNVGGLYGGEGSNFSSYLTFAAEASESVVHGFDLFAPIDDKERYTHQKTGNIEDGLPYEDAFFDTVYLGEVFEHFYNPGFVLKEVGRVLKSDGVLVLDTPNAYNVKRIIRWVFGRKEHMGDPTHTILFTPGSLVSMLEKSGFTITCLGQKTPKHFLYKLCGLGLGSHLLVAAEKNS